MSKKIERPYIWVGGGGLPWGFIQVGTKRVWSTLGLSEHRWTEREARHDGGKEVYSRREALRHVSSKFKPRNRKVARGLIASVFPPRKKSAPKPPERAYYLGTHLDVDSARSVTVFRTGQKFAEVRVWSHVGESSACKVLLKDLVENHHEFYVKTHSRAEAREFFKNSRFVDLIP